MNNKVIVAIVVIVVLLLAGGGFYLMSHKNAAQNAQSEQATPAPTPSAQPQKSLKDLFSMGSQQCTFTLPEGGTGTVYVGDQKMRGDINTTVAGKPLVSHIIVNNQISYIWLEGQTTGFKMSFAGVSPTPQASGSSASQPIDLNQKVNYSCQPWTVDSDKFTLPSKVKFSDFSSFMKPAQATGGAAPDTKTLQCAACDQAPEAARAQCKAALGCK